MYYADMPVNGTGKDTGAIRDDKEELKFGITTSSSFPNHSIYGGTQCGTELRSQ
jgi:hypothetical protein